MGMCTYGPNIVFVGSGHRRTSAHVEAFLENRLALVFVSGKLICLIEVAVTLPSPEAVPMPDADLHESNVPLLSKAHAFPGG